MTPYAIPQTTFRDISVDPGISYFYTVTAVDKNGNESLGTNSQKILVPKTP